MVKRRGNTVDRLSLEQLKALLPSWVIAMLKEGELDVMNHKEARDLYNIVLHNVGRLAIVEAIKGHRPRWQNEIQIKNKQKADKLKALGLMKKDSDNAIRRSRNRKPTDKDKEDNGLDL